MPRTRYSSTNSATPLLPVSTDSSGLSQLEAIPAESHTSLRSSYMDQGDLSFPSVDGAVSSESYVETAVLGASIELPEERTVRCHTRRSFSLPELPKEDTVVKTVTPGSVVCVDICDDTHYESLDTTDTIGPLGPESQDTGYSDNEHTHFYDNNSNRASTNTRLDRAGETWPTIADSHTQPFPPKLSRDEIEVINNYDHIVRGFQRATVENRDIQRRFQSLKRMFYILSFISVTIFLFLIAFLVLLVWTSNFKESDNMGSLGVSATYVDRKLELLEEELMSKELCLQCSVLTELMGSGDFILHHSSDEPWKCCIKDLAELLEPLLQKVESIGPKFNSVLDNLESVVNGLQSNSSRSVSEGSRSLVGSLQNLADRGANKGAIHLVGSYNKMGRDIKWQNKVSPSSLTLTRDSKKIIIGNQGNYFMYAQIVFDLWGKSNTTRPLSFKIFELDNHGGTRVLEEVQSTFDGNSEGISSNKCMTHRVVHFDKGDKVYLQLHCAFGVRVAPGLGTGPLFSLSVDSVAKGNRAEGTFMPSWRLKCK